MTQPDMLAQSRGRYVFDTETNGLLDACTQMHCAVMEDLDTGEIHDFGPDQIPEFLKLFQAANTLVGHFIIGFDLLVIKKLFGVSPHPDCEIIDTVNLSRLVFSDLKNTDIPMAIRWKKWKLRFEADLARQKEAVASAWGDDQVNDWTYEPYYISKPHEFPGQFTGLHSLESWGYRMGAEKKGDYSKDMKAKGLDPWFSWNGDMHSYMIQDATVNVALYHHLLSFSPSPQSVELEMGVQLLCTQMEQNGWPFDVKAAQALYSELAAEREALSVSLRSLFPPWTVQLEDFIPKRPNKSKGYLTGVPVERFETIEFNPGSRQHIENRLRDKYDWQPTEFAKDGRATIDDDVLSNLPYPEAKSLARYFMLQKRIGQIAEGPQAWLKLTTREGKIHGRYSTNGTVTGRAAHFNPNVGQVPSVGAEFGRECRACFTVPKGWRQLGADQSGLELRCLGSYLSGFDGGAYIETVLFGDIHWENAKAIFALDPTTVRDDTNKRHKAFRGYAKTIIYAILYGAGDGKVGSIVGKGAQAGRTIRSRLEAQFPALKLLIKQVKKASKRGWLKGLDGRKIPVRSPHAALNSLLQSAGAVICKQWIVDAEKALKGAGLKHGWDGDFVFLGWIHDEVQLAIRDGVNADLVSTCIITAGREAGTLFPSWKCPLDVEVKLGTNWSETH